MFIDFDLLLTYGAAAKKYKKAEFIFYEGDVSRFYYQVLEGKVKCVATMKKAEFYAGNVWSG
ncbi:MAG: hypothetical protein IPG79_18515 [Saprospiraceae bacterium]|nr:hypothetical protein [Saprospiraceae bacterium]